MPPLFWNANKGKPVGVATTIVVVVVDEGGCVCGPGHSSPESSLLVSPDGVDALSHEHQGAGGGHVGVEV